MTIGTILARLLTHFSPEERTIPDATAYPGRNAAGIGAINGALQELFGSKSPWTRRGTEGFLLYAPSIVTATVTEGSKTIAFGGSWDARFAGCTIRINGASCDNQVIAETSGGTATMVLPHDGTSGSQSVTVYHDCLALPSTVAEVLRPVTIKGGPFLSPVPSRASLRVMRSSEEDYGFDKLVPNPLNVEVAMQEVVGIPQLYCVEQHQSDTWAVPSNRLVVFPAPSAQTLVTARVRYAAPIYATTDTSKEVPIPLEYVDSILIPVAEQHLTRCEFFRNEAAKPAIAAAYQEAIRQLQSLSPQTSHGVTFRPLM